MDGVYYGSDSSEHAEDGEGFQEGVATGAATDALPPPSDDGKDDVGGGGDAPQHQKLKRMRGSAGGGGGGGGDGNDRPVGSDDSGSGVGGGGGCGSSGGNSSDCTGAHPPALPKPGDYAQMTKTQQRNWRKKTGQKKSLRKNGRILNPSA